VQWELATVQNAVERMAGGSLPEDVLPELNEELTEALNRPTDEQSSECALSTRITGRPPSFGGRPRTTTRTPHDTNIGTLEGFQSTRETPADPLQVDSAHTSQTDSLRTDPARRCGAGPGPAVADHPAALDVLAQLRTAPTPGPGGGVEQLRPLPARPHRRTILGHLPQHDRRLLDHGGPDIGPGHPRRSSHAQTSHLGLHRPGAGNDAGLGDPGHQCRHRRSEEGP